MLDAHLHHALDDAPRERGSGEAPPKPVPDTSTDATALAAASAYAVTERDAAAHPGANASSHASTNAGTVNFGGDARCPNRGDAIGRRGDKLVKRGAGIRG